MVLIWMCTGCLSLNQPEIDDSLRVDGASLLSIIENGSLQNPAWSPDGSYLLITRFRNSYNHGPADLLVVDLQSGDSRILVSDGSVNVNLPGSSWNPATRQITFSSSRDPHDEIYFIAASGEPGSERRITNRDELVAYEPSFSPGGEWVVFESHPEDVEGEGEIVKYKIDGAQSYTRLSNPGADTRQPNWSPTEDLIVYQSYVDGQWDIWVMDSDGKNQRKLTRGPGDKTDASFSPDGEWIVYSGQEVDNDAANLFIVSALGGDPIRITRFDGYDGAPSWSPDGKSIVFESYPGDPDNSPGTTIWLIEVPSH